MKLTFSVEPPSTREPAKSGVVVLQKDNWDDFGYKTQYHLWLFDERHSGFIGNVKIYKVGQGETPSGILPLGRLEPLGEEFCSLGQSLDYYERLAALPPELRGGILKALRDAVAFPEHAGPFKEEYAWGRSITREVDIASFEPMAAGLLSRDYSALPTDDLTFTFQPNGWDAALQLAFSAPEAQGSIWVLDDDDHSLPERVAVVTGRNGSGKSTLLARLARVLHASQRDRGRARMKALGKLEPAGLGFSRIVTVAYSAFDTFQVPGVDEAERRQIIKDLQTGKGRYFFCGLRDIARELEEELAAADDNEDVSDEGGVGVAPDDPIALDRQSGTILKTAGELGVEFSRTIDQIEAANRTGLFRRALRLLLADPSFDDAAGQLPEAVLGDDPAAEFMRWSTGHKIVMHTIAMLVAHVEPKSIVLMDEPESHLHPPLLAALMHAVRLVLRKREAFAVIATHSPVVAQETLGRHVSVVRRSGDAHTIVPARIETYGESIGEITEMVFGLDTNQTDYHATLRGLVRRGLGLDELEAIFDRGLSLQARAYVMSLVAAQQG